MFASNGDSGPPCGVPSTLLATTPSTIAPARRYRPMSFNTRLSRIACAIFLVRVHLGGDVGAGGRFGADQRGGAGDLDDLQTDAIHLAEIRAHAIPHDL